MPGSAAHILAPCLLAGLVAAAAALPARAQTLAQPSDEAKAAAAACPTGGGDARARLDCLGAALKASETELERSLAATRAAITARADLAEVQRRRWLGLIEEAQGRFTHWRDFECQSIAPYESGDETTVGGRRIGIGSLSERMLCLIHANGARAADLAHRYPAPPGWSYEPPAAPAPADPAPAISGTPRIIVP